MGKTRPPWEERTTALIDEIGAVNRVLWRSQAQQAALMVEFCAARKAADKQLIANQHADGPDPLFKAGEFAAGEVSLAVKTSKYTTQRIIAMTRRVQAEAPDAWDAWAHGDIDHDKVVRINRALRRLVHDRSKALLNDLVVPVAIEKTPEILGRWLNRFIAEVEPDETDERLNRALDDRYVSVRPDLDGMSFLHAAISSVDAVAVDQLLNAVASIVEPGDERSKQQRRADTLVDLLCGRISNGWHPDFDTNSDTDDHLDDEPPHPAAPDEGIPQVGPPDQDDDRDGTADSLGGPDENVHRHNGALALGGNGAERRGNCAEGPGNSAEAHGNSAEAHGNSAAVSGNGAGRGEPAMPVNTTELTDADCTFLPDHDLPGQDWDAHDWELPASAFRPDPHDAASPSDPAGGTDVSAPAPSTAPRLAPTPARTMSASGTCQLRPPAVTIGVVITAGSLFGYSNMPGQLIDRSALVPADTIRDLAQQPGTLFYRLLTDDAGKLLDVTELGRFPTRKLGLAVAFRDGTCGHPGCHRPATGCDLDHLTPAPLGPTSAANIGPKCRNDHRCKTHAGHRTTRQDDVTEWTTPTGHTYTTHDQPFPVDQWPDTG